MGASKRFVFLASLSKTSRAVQFVSNDDSFYSTYLIPRALDFNRRSSLQRFERSDQKAAKVLGCDLIQLERIKALRVLGVTDEEVEHSRTIALSSFGTALEDVEVRKESKPFVLEASCLEV
jgi:hypothetical protein